MTAGPSNLAQHRCLFRTTMHTKQDKGGLCKILSEMRKNTYKILTKSFSSHTLMGRLKNLSDPIRSIRFFHLSTSVYDEFFFVSLISPTQVNVILQIKKLLRIKLLFIKSLGSVHDCLDAYFLGISRGKTRQNDIISTACISDGK